jgi:hypothetical protein
LLRIVKYFLTTVFVILFGAVVIGYSWYFEKINNKIYSTKIVKTLTMNNNKSGPATESLNRDKEAPGKAATTKEEPADDDSDYRNPALDYMGSGNNDPNNTNYGEGVSGASGVLNQPKGNSSPSTQGRKGNMFGDVMQKDNTTNDTYSENIFNPEDSESQSSVTKPKAIFSGYYRLQIEIEDGSEFNTNAQIEEIGGSKLRISGKHAYTNYSFIGIPIDVTTDTGSWRIEADTSRLFSGTADISITREYESYQMEGKGSGLYNLFLIKGEKNAKISGLKLAETAPANTEPSVIDSLNTAVAFVAPEKGVAQPSPLASAGASAAAAMAAIIIGYSAVSIKKENSANYSGNSKTVPGSGNATKADLQRGEPVKSPAKSEEVQVDDDEAVKKGSSDI